MISRAVLPLDIRHNNLARFNVAAIVMIDALSRVSTLMETNSVIDELASPLCAFHMRAAEFARVRTK